MFTPINFDSGRTVSLKMAASSTVAKGDALEFASGYVQRADASTAEVRYIALEAKTTAGGENPEILCLEVSGVRFEGDTAGNTSQALVGTKVDLTDHDTINQAASTTDIFFVEAIVGAAANRKVQGFFVKKEA